MRVSNVLMASAAIALLAASPLTAATITDNVSFVAADFGSFPSGTAPVDPVTGSFTITYDPTQTYLDTTSGISLDSLNITLDSPLSFSYSPTGPNADDLFVGGAADTAELVQFNPATNDFTLSITGFSTAPGFNNLTYAQVASGNNVFFTQGPTGTVTVTPVVASAPEPATWAVMVLGLFGLGAAMRAARRRAATPEVAAPLAS